MKEISEWLENKNPSYTDGLQLLQIHKPKSFAISLCKARTSAYNLNLIRKELSSLVSLPIQMTASEKITETPVLVEKLNRIMKDEFKRANHLFMTSLRSSDHKEREEAAAHILKSFSKVIHPIQKDLKYYKNFKKLPENHYLTIKVTEEISDVDIKQQILNLRSQISKNKNKPDRKSEVEKWKTQKLQLEAILKSEND